MRRVSELRTVTPQTVRARTRNTFVYYGRRTSVCTDFSPRSNSLLRFGDEAAVGVVVTKRQTARPMSHLRRRLCLTRGRPDPCLCDTERPVVGHHLSWCALAGAVVPPRSDARATPGPVVRPPPAVAWPITFPRRLAAMLASSCARASSRYVPSRGSGSEKWPTASHWPPGKVC